MTKYQYRVEDPKFQKQEDAKDFKRLNKVVLKEGATNAAANRQLRKNHGGLKVGLRPGKMAMVSQSMPNQEFAFGRPNRPQTPVHGIIMNNYGEESEMHLANKYAVWKHSVSFSRSNLV